MLSSIVLGFTLAIGIAGAAIAQPKPAAPGPTGPAGAPALNLRNATPNIINNVYISLSSSQSWGADHLGATETLGTNATRAFPLPAGECLYDIRIVYQGDIAEERRRIDACANQSLVLPLAAQRAAR